MMAGFDEVADATISAGARIATAGGILAAGYLLARVARLLVRRVLGRPQIAGALGPSILQLIGSGVYYLLIALASGLALIALGVPSTYVAAIALILLALIAIALRESIANFAATVIFLMFQPFRRGELIETMDRIGVVHEILLFNTVLLLLDHRLVTLPNSKIQESGVVNYTRMGHIRADISLTVAYGEDLRHVQAAITDVVTHDPRVLAHPPFEIMVKELGEDGVRLLIMPMVAPEHYWSALSDFREQIKARFDAEGIRFAVPRHEVRLTADKGAAIQNWPP